MALGARRSGVVAMILGGAQRPLLAGVLLALPAALLASRVIDSMLFGLTGSDPWAIGGATLVLVSVAHLAAWIPARRASRVDPLVALRHE
jgi:ABC-type antimicrobial peptide transport system permease subunit